MKPAGFDMARPASLGEALTILAQHADEAKVIAGGQTLVPVMNFRMATPRLLIDLNKVAELAGIRRDGNVLRIGAMTRQCELLRNPLIGEHAPLLSKAVPHIGHVQTRSRGTVGGSLAHADPAAELPLVMVTLDATLTIRSHEKERTVSARGFFRDVMATDLANNELLTDIAIPIAPRDARCSFRELARRHGDFAIVAVAAQRSAAELSVAIGGLESAPRYCRKLVEGIARAGFDRGRLPDLIRLELDETTALGDLHASAGFRRHLAGVLLQDCLDEILGP
jgi:2-furoyl-CoA dehydrogenase FAD binding subunit